MEFSVLYRRWRYHPSGNLRTILSIPLAPMLLGYVHF
jgi:hypothetical protein